MSRLPGWAWWLIGLAVAAGLAAGIVVVLARTAWGQERVLDQTIRFAGRQLQGTLAIERISGNLLTGAQIYNVSLHGFDGEPLLVADSGYVDYNLRTLLGNRTVIDYVVLHNPRLRIRRMPGDSLWNFQEILRDTTDRGPSERTTVLSRIAFRNANVTVISPWEPDGELRGAARRSAIREAVDATVRLMVDSVPGGFVRTSHFRQMDGELVDLVLGPEAGGGTYLRIRRIRGLAYVYRDPVRIRQARGEVAIRDGRTEVRADTVLLPASRLTGYGVVHPGDTLRYDFVFQADTAASRDFQWLYPNFPERGGGTLRLKFETRPDGTLIHVTDARLSAPGTRVRGNFGVLLGDTVRFFDVGLTAEPLDVRTVEQMLPTALPVRGLRIGAVEIRNPTP
ncbi:hypothetical protein BH20GEM3_BH20GEM3_08220 [soil metagenome]